MLLNSSDPNGLCYVETKSLDGETNLKIKTTHKDLQDYFTTEDMVLKVDGQIICEKPNNAIYKFEGMAKIPQIKNQVALNAENILLRGSSLKNTARVYGISIFTGKDTKVMQNSQSAKYKFSSLEKLMNHSILIIVVLQITIATISGYYGADWIKGNETRYDYLQLEG